MTDQLPERIWIDAKCIPDNDDEAGTYYIDGPDQEVLTVAFVPEDTATPRAEADAMVAAVLDLAVEAMRETCDEDNATDEALARMAIKSVAPNASAALQQIVQEAVEAERARWQTAITLIERVYYMEGKDAGWRAAHMNGIARTAQDGGDLTGVRRMFPRARKETSE